MARGTGIYGAYQNVRPIAEDFGDILAQDEQMRFMYREEQRKKQALADEKAKDLRDTIVKARNALYLNPTGVKSFDEKQVELALMGAEKIDEAYEVLKDNPYDIEASAMLANLESLPERFKTMQDYFTGRIQDWTKGSMDGTYSEYLNKDWLNKLDKTISQGLSMGLDTKGNVIASFDKNMDGVPDLSWGGVSAGIDVPAFKERFNPEAFKTELKKHYGYETVWEDDPRTGEQYMTTRRKGLSAESRNRIQGQVNNAFGATLKDITDDGLSYIADELNQDPASLSEQQFQKIKQDFTNENYAMFDFEDKQIYQRADENADLSRAQRGYLQRMGIALRSRNKDQQVADFTKTLVDGTIRGDQASLGHWYNVTDREGNKIVNVDYTGDDVVFTYQGKGKNSDQKYTVTVDLKDQNAVGQLASMSNFRESPQEMMAFYNTGNLFDQNFTYEQPTNFAVGETKLNVEQAMSRPFGSSTTSKTASVAEAIDKTFGSMDGYDVSFKQSNPLIGFSTNEVYVDTPDGRVTFDLKEDSANDIMLWVEQQVQTSGQGAEGDSIFKE